MARKIIQADGVDLKNGIIQGNLKQIRIENSNSDTELVDLQPVWCCEIEPKWTKLIVSLVRDHILPYDENDLSHLKRFKKIKNEAGQDAIQAVLCTVPFISNELQLNKFVEENTNEAFKFDIYKVNIPMNMPQTKELCNTWSELYWPLNWKGNPNHQFLNSVKFDMEYEKLMVNKLIDEIPKYDIKCGIPLVTIFARPNESLQPEILCIYKNSGCSNPYEHTIIKGIDIIANKEKNSRLRDNHKHNYLCHDLIVYTTNEPCVMCCMALVHSRIGRVIYLKESPNSGGFESNYYLGNRNGLNWKFEIWKWIGNSELDKFNSMLPSENTPEANVYSF